MKKARSRKVNGTPNYLLEYGITNSMSKSAEIMLEIQPELWTIPQCSPIKYVNKIWKKVESNSKLQNSKESAKGIRGSLFEMTIACCLIREGIAPFFRQAELQFVPLAHFDLLIYTDEMGPVVLSLKTSLRERYKQAEFEAQAMKGVHRRAKNYLITADEVSVVRSLKQEIESGELSGLDDIISIYHKEFDSLISKIKSWTIVDNPNFYAIKHAISKVSLI